MVNIPLDEGSKVIPDITWVPDAKDTLFLLENGGGKTSIIQLIMQTIIPNATLGGRSLKNTITKGASGHIVTEWLLDGSHTKYVCLGFSFMNEKTASKDIHYYNYHFTYNDEYTLKISTLPLTNQQKIATFTEYKKYLQQTDQARIQIADSNEKYMEQIEKYRILSQGWKYMQKINDDEGGVAEFFEKAKTEEDLLKRLLIPIVEDSVYQTPEEQGELFNSFKSFQHNLSKIPELKKDLQDFEVIEEQVEKILSAVQRFSEKQKSFAEEKRHLEILQFSYSAYKETVQKKETKTLALIHQLQVDVLELDWKIKSHDVHLAYEKWTSAQNRLRKIKKNRQEEEEKEKYLKRNHQELQALLYFNQLSEERQEEETYVQKIEITQLNKSEKNQEFEKTKIELEKSWNVVTQIKGRELKEEKKKHRYLLETKKEVENKLQKQRENEKNYLVSFTELTFIMDQHRSAEKDMIEQIGFEETKNISSFYEQKIVKKERTLLDIEDLKNQKMQGEKVKESYISDVHTLNLEEQGLQKELENAQEHLRNYQEDAVQLKETLAGVGRVEHQIWEEKTEAEFRQLVLD
jgi:hypothetical protein